MVLNNEEKSLTSLVRIIKEHSYHYHNSLTILKVIAGEIEVRVWARNNVLKAGDIIIFNPGEVHKISSITETNLVSITHIGLDLCRQYYEAFDTCVILVNSYRYKHVIPEKYTQLNRLYKSLLQVLCSDEQFDLSSSKDILRDFIFLLAEDFDYVSGGVALKRFSDAVVKRYKSLFKRVFRTSSTLSHATLKDIAKETGVHYSYLRSDIVERYGFGFQWLKNTYKTEKAARMLMDTEESIMSICINCGFSDPKYFIKYFKIFFECTPSEYRKQYKNNVSCENDYVDLSMNHVMTLIQEIK